MIVKIIILKNLLFCIVLFNFLSAQNADITPPTISSIDVEGPVYLKNSDKISFTLSFSEPLQEGCVPKVELINNSDPRYTYDINLNTSGRTELIITPNIKDGQYSLIITGAIDTAGNSLKPYTYFQFYTVDQTPPDISKATVIINDGSLYSNDHINILNINGIMDANGISSFYYNFNKLSKSDAISFNEKKKIISFERDGVYKCYIWAQDSAGNESDILTTNIIIDTKPPEIESYNIRAEKYLKDGREIIVSIQFSEPLQVDIPVSLILQNAKIDSLNYKTEFINQNSAVLKITSDMVNGEYLLNFINATDLSGLLMEPYIDSTKYIIDTNAPDTGRIITNLPNNINNHDSIIIDLVGFNDAGSGIAHYYYSLSDSNLVKPLFLEIRQLPLKINNLTEGKLVISCYAQDKANNISEIISKSLIIDFTPPKVKDINTKIFSSENKFILNAGIDFSEAVREINKANIGILQNNLKRSFDIINQKMNKDSNKILLELELYDINYDPPYIMLNLENIYDLADNKLMDFTPKRIELPVHILYLKANELFTNHDYQSSLDLCEIILNQEKYYSDAMFLMGMNLIRLNNSEEAENILKKLVQLFPSYRDGYIKLAELSKKKSDIVNEEYYLRKVDFVVDSHGENQTISPSPYVYSKSSLKDMPKTEFSSNEIDVKNQIVQFLFRNHYYKDAIEMINNLEFEKKSLWNYNLAVCYLYDNQLKNAKMKFQEFLIQNANDIDALNNMGIILIKQNSQLKSIEYFKKALEINDDFFKAKHNLIIAENFENAGIIKTKLAAIGYKALPEALFNYAKTLQIVEADYSEILNLYQKSKIYEAFVELFTLLYKNKKYAEAYEQIIKALEIHPTSIIAHYYAGLVFHAMGEKNQAAKEFSWIIDWDNSHIDGHIQLGVIYSEMGFNQKAEYFYKKAAVLQQQKYDEIKVFGSIGIMKFKNSSSNQEYAWLETGLSEAFSSDLKQFKQLTIIDRYAIEKELKKIEDVFKIINAQKSPAKIGYIIGADNILTGSYQINKSSIRIDVRIFSSETGKLIKVLSRSDNIENLIRIERAMVFEIAYALGIPISQKEKKILLNLPKDIDGLKLLSLAKQEYNKGNIIYAQNLFNKVMTINPDYVSSLLNFYNYKTEDTGREEFLAILPFENTSKMSKYDWFSEGIAEALTTDLQQIAGINLVERMQLHKAIEEIGLGMTGIIDEATAPKVGKQAGASVILSGSFQIVDDQIRIDARIIATQNQKVLLSENMNGPVTDILQLEQALAIKIANSLNVTITAIEQKKLQDQSNKTLAILSGIRDVGIRNKEDQLEEINDYENTKKSISSIKSFIKLQGTIFELSFVVSTFYGFYSYFKSDHYYDLYKKAETYEEMNKYKRKTKEYDDYIIISSIAAGGSFILALICNKYHKKLKTLSKMNADIISKDGNTLCLSLGMSF